MSDQEHPEQQPDMTEQAEQQRSGPREHVERAGPKVGGSRISRRDLLVGAGAVAVGGALAMGGYTRATLAATPASVSVLPPPGQSGIEHIVLVMMENRSFDHFLGWLPGANGEQAGLSYPDPSGALHPTYPLAPDYQGCGHPDPDHSYSGGRVQYDGGRCDGWLLDTNNDIYSIGYYTQNDLAFLGQAATAWTVCDNYYPAILGPTFPNRIYQHAGQTDRLENTTTISTLPTIWDRLAAAGISGHYYFSDLPFLAIWGAKYLPISRSIATFFANCAAGTLPAVSYVDPRFVGEDSGTSGDDHPHADIRNGEVFLNQVYTAVTASPAWSSTILVFNFDEWGGFFDHVPPPAAPIPPATQAAGDTDGRRGFRVPGLIIAPWARRGAIAHTLRDHTSVLRLIEWRWGLPPLTIRDKTAHNLASALDFAHPVVTAPQFNVPPGPFGGACPVGPVGPVGSPGATSNSATSNSNEEWTAIETLARRYGWPV